MKRTIIKAAEVNEKNEFVVSKKLDSDIKKAIKDNAAQARTAFEVRIIKLSNDDDLEKLLIQKLSQASAIDACLFRVNHAMTVHNIATKLVEFNYFATLQDALSRMKRHKTDKTSRSAKRIIDTNNRVIIINTERKNMSQAQESA